MRGQTTNWRIAAACLIPTLLLIILTVSFAELTASTAAADAPEAAGDLDTTFNGTGMVTTDVGAFGNDAGNGMTIQADGKIVVVGQAASTPSVDAAIVRYNTDGSLDTTFSGDGIALAHFATGATGFDAANAVAIQPDQKLVVVGTTQAPSTIGFIARFNTDGSLDTTFGGGDGWALALMQSTADVVIQPDGKIIVAGSQVSGVSDGQARLQRYNADGTSDNGFGNGIAGPGTLVFQYDTFAGTDHTADAVLLQPDGKIVAGGCRASGSCSYGIARFTETGQLDPTFDEDGRVNTAGVGQVLDLALQTDGKLIAFGFFAQDMNATRYNTDGSLDTTFNGTGRFNVNVLGDDFARAGMIQADGKILLTGGAGGVNPKFAAARVNPNGGLDTTFSGDGVQTIDFDTGSGVDTGRDAALDSGGRVVIAGTASNRYAVTRLLGDVGEPSPTPTPTPTPTATPTPEPSPSPSASPGSGLPSSALVVTTATATRQSVLFPDPMDAPTDQVPVSGLPANAVPRSVAYIGNDTALVADSGSARVFVVQPSTGTLLSTIPTTGHCAGMDALVAGPQLTHALAIDGNKLCVINAPFDASSTVSSITLPATVNDQTRSIVIDRGGRAFVRSTVGVSVIDAPYTSIAFTMPATLSPTGTIDITPDGNKLLVTHQQSVGSSIFAYDAPFSETSTSQTIPSNTGLVTIVIAPDGQKAILIVNTPFDKIVRTVNAPFQPGASGQTLTMPGDYTGCGDLTWSADSSTVVLSGCVAGAPNRMIKGPFTTAGAQVSTLTINGATPNGGVGSARFIPTEFAVGKTKYDFDGDGRADLGVFRPMPDPASNYWYIRRSSNDTTYVTEWGIETDHPAAADYDGDGKTDIAVWREEADPDRAKFYILRSSDSSFQIEQFGRTGDKPSVVGDWDGDERADVAVFRNGGEFYYRPSSQPGSDFTRIPWGVAGDVAVPGDFDGDGKQDAAVFRQSDSTWYIRQSSNGTARYEQWGIVGDRRVVADYDGDGSDDLAAFRNGVWYIKQSSNGQPMYINFGVGSDTVVPADYDGDGRADAAVYRGGTWYINRSTAGMAAFEFGLAADKPVNAVMFDFQ